MFCGRLSPLAPSDLSPALLCFAVFPLLHSPLFLLYLHQAPYTSGFLSFLSLLCLPVPPLCPPFISRWSVLLSTPLFILSHFQPPCSPVPVFTLCFRLLSLPPFQTLFAGYPFFCCLLLCLLHSFPPALLSLFFSSCSPTSLHFLSHSHLQVRP